MGRLRCQLGVLSKADGSCRYIENLTEVVVGIRGPRMVTFRVEQPHLALIEVEVYSGDEKIALQAPSLRQQLQGVAEGVIIRQAYPRTAIHIHVQIAYDNGRLLSTCINALSCALLEAGLHL